jgi:hypothetical protein
MRTVIFLAALALTSGCFTRTTISARPQPPKPPPTYVDQSGCQVHDFAAATDLPVGSRNLGWVKVEEQESDEATYVLLRQKICELGGDALSQPSWEKLPSADKPFLQANAWVLP